MPSRNPWGSTSMTSEEQECLSRKYTRDKVMLQLLPTGNIAILDSYYNLVAIIPPVPALSDLLYHVVHRPPQAIAEGRTSTKPDRLNINIEDLDI